MSDNHASFRRRLQIGDKVLVKQRGPNGYYIPARVMKLISVGYNGKVEVRYSDESTETVKRERVTPLNQEQSR